MNSALSLEAHLHTCADPAVAETAKRFYKHGKKETRSLGIRMPKLRVLARQNPALPFTEVLTLLRSPCHESRLLALLILVQKMKRGDEQTQKQIYNFYLNHTAFINSWDLVDCSAYFIVGPYLENKSRAPLYELAKSPSLWERRIAMLSTLHFIRKNDFDDSLKLAEILLSDPEDLIHKVVGWMLKEIGNRDKPALADFLQSHIQAMHRTTLRYAIEKFPKAERQTYLHGNST
ncbi:DNA alkylation repair protein [Kiritimatiellaeota bacterium B1221]|nr:DNA alkylation repair protein [Kiritimatiellaeota bacterium B1221]